MSDRPSLRDLIEVQARFHLPSPALVEKDWFVIQALRAIVAADKGSFQLVFQGGTALSRPWGLINRMSEDIDAWRGRSRQESGATTLARRA